MTAKEYVEAVRVATDAANEAGRRLQQVRAQVPKFQVGGRTFCSLNDDGTLSFDGTGILSETFTAEFTVWFRETFPEAMRSAA